MAECTEMSRASFWCVNCNSSGHASWDRLCPTFLDACKCTEGADPKHTYKFFPGCNAWTWEQEPGFKDLRPPSWHGPFNNLPNWDSQDWQDEYQPLHMAGTQHARHDGWPNHLNTAGPAEQVGTTSQGGPRAASRQSRLDEFPPTSAAPGKTHLQADTAT